jgi:nitroimidazol reductase NimA-like FMN-containing flavoprotein (pyridoxamine 5'-phosphate oxidase superfamily)
MPARDLNQEEIVGVLQQQRIVRIAFSDEGGCYLIPLGYVWYGGAISCISSEGRKVRLARKDGRVSFQVDSSAGTGPYSWRSVTGRGTAEVVTEQDEIARVFPLLMARFSEMPEWARAEFAARERDSRYVLLRITPVLMTGRAYEETAE